MSINISFLVLLLLFLSSNASGNARVSRMVLKEPTTNHLFSKDRDSKLDRSSIATQHGTKKSSVPYEAVTRDDSFLEFEQENVIDNNVEVEHTRRKDSEVIKVSSASVSWRSLTGQKRREVEKPEFISDYVPVRSRTPVNNIGFDCCD